MAVVTLSQAADLARSLLDAEGLRGFTLGWIEDDRRQVRRGRYKYADLGLTLHLQGRILLSKADVFTFGRDDFIDTVKHEIAHALLGTNDHGADWRDLASSMGVDIADYV